MTNNALRRRWESRRDEYARVGAHVDGARVITEFLSDLDALQRTEGDIELTLAKAATISGYSREHLARLVRAGKIPNAGRAQAPRVRLQDLPRRPKMLAERGTKAYDADADARSLRGRLGDC